MVADWTDRTEILDRLETLAGYIYQARVKCSSVKLALTGWNVEEPGATLQTLGVLMYQLTDAVTDALMYHLDYKGAFEPPYIIPYYLKHHTIVDTGETEEYNLTWEKIINVWMMSGLEGHQWTVGMIDYMRKVIWDKPFNFPLVPGQVGGG